LRERGVRGLVEIELFAPEPKRMPVAGPVVGNAIAKMLKERNISFFCS